LLPAGGNHYVCVHSIGYNGYMIESIDTKSSEFLARAEQRRRTWTMTAHCSINDMKASEYAYWSTQPAHLVMSTVAEMAAAAHGLKGIHVRRLQRPHRTPE
jgi:hypothetical protein